MQVRIAKRRLGGSGRLPLPPKFSAYFAERLTDSLHLYQPLLKIFSGQLRL
jgi:hypothetical protein